MRVTPYVPVVPVVLVSPLPVAVGSSRVGLATAQVPCEGLDEAGSRATVGLGLLEAVDDVAKVDGSVLLVLLICPPLYARLVDVALLERVEESVDLLLDLVGLLLLVAQRLRHLD